MKSKLILLGLVLFGISCFSQDNNIRYRKSSFGVSGGLNICNSIFATYGERSPDYGYSLSLDYCYNISQEMCLNTGIGVSKYSFNGLGSDVYKWQFDYYNVPLSFSYTKNRFIYSGGIKLYLLYRTHFKSWDHSEWMHNDVINEKFNRLFQYGTDISLAYSLPVSEKIEMQIVLPEITFIPFESYLSDNSLLVFEVKYRLKFF